MTRAHAAKSCGCGVGCLRAKVKGVRPLMPDLKLSVPSVYGIAVARGR